MKLISNDFETDGRHRRLPGRKQPAAVVAARLHRQEEPQDAAAQQFAGL